ncbi:DUF3347 domain-containing protein [Mucilaginibacter sp. dw_454]|uniref:DUF3347 domain-containing protein n=1 Tax=Mucilaginibacter sp. dw_454 TaxID=2720079 RepID=UPI001BD28A29|nr:DUF3347 domain-containing protein [Mucilaginibacter sp. dw_454]
MKNIRSVLLLLLLLGIATYTKAQTTVSTSINGIIVSYLELKNALATDDNPTAQLKAKVLNDEIVDVQSKGMTPQELSTWKNYSDRLSFDSRHISESKSIDHQREHFASLSKNMYTLLKVFRVNTSPLYWDYCPMKKVSWLSDKQAIENPYYGKTMLDCGSVKETLKEAK